ncbi:MAG: cation transporter [Rhodospirillaceae bacterium]|jgi:divalent metal cation (Fe/Co/Zn/Cd) transporter|nr:cation transporter [Rhodospirillaceae bacterium]
MTDIAKGVGDKGGAQPTDKERGQESSVLYTWLADTAFFVLYLVIAVLTGSMTMISEVVRGALMLAASFYGFLVMRALHRDRLRRFEFGVGKLEQFVAVVTGLGLIVSGLWVANGVIDAVLSGGHAASPFGLAAAAVTNAVNTLINVLGWYAMIVASHEGERDVFKTQIRVRFTMMVGSLFIQVTMTAAALAKDPGLALILDAAGAIFIVGLMLVSGTSMIVRSLPDLLDSPATADLGALIRETAARVIPAEADLRVRTRRSGRTVFAEVAVGAPPASAATLRDWRVAIERALETVEAEVEVSVVQARQ